MSSHLLRAAIRRFLLQIGLVLVVGAASDASAQSNIKAGSGVMAGSNIRHPNGLTFDQVLMTGPTVTVAADPTEVVRVSFLDVNDDITQVEFSGPGSVTVELDNATYQPPAPPAKYHQPGVNYVKGRPTVRVQGAGANSFINIFSVGRGNAVNQALFPAGAVYDAMADVQLLRIEGTDMGGVLTGNVRYGGTLSAIGVEAPNTRVQYRLVIGEIDAQEQAVPLLRIGANSPLVQDGGAVLVAGGDLAQSNGMPIDTASGTGAPLPRINAVAGTLSSGDAVPAKVIGSEFASRDAG
ncbi:MAG TPA: hypothetical protein VEQ65_03225, partial [Opitutus sp.]|nr:hypothetical protein [Opitutus sp.]